MHEFIRLLHSYSIKEVMSIIPRQLWMWQMFLSKDHNVHLNCHLWGILGERWILKEKP